MHHCKVLMANAPAVTLALALSLGAVPAWALKTGEAAPGFAGPSALAGVKSTFTLHTALQRGPVVLYFFPLAFSEGCSIEARAFAEATDRFSALGATVVGVSGNDLDTLARFSVRVCNGKFAVVSDPSQAIMKSYGAVLDTRPDFAARVSFVIAPDGTVAHIYKSLNPQRHVEETLGAVRSLPKTDKP